MRRLLLITLSSLIAFSGLFLHSNHASANQQLKNKINEVQGKRADIKDDSQETKSEINEIKQEEEKVRAEIKRLDMAVAETAERVRQKQGEIEQTTAEIEQLRLQIEELQIRIDKRDEMLKTRVRSVQENGGVVSYLDVLLGAKSFGDFLNRVNSVSIIVQQDKEILQTHVTEQETLEEIKIEVENKLVQLEAAKVQLEKEKATYEAQTVEKEKLMAQLKQKEEELEGELLDLQEQDEILAKQQASYERLYKQWQEEQRRIAEAKARGETPPVTDGTFMRPSNGPVTSNYGKRWGKLHAGIDIGKRGSSVPIVAAADGIVFRSYYSSSYGNVVFVSHNIGGTMYTTLYAHMESRKVSEGDSVKKGQLVGYMGNTGRSTGPHLHFEIHKGPWNASKSNAVDPRKLINF
ncbi:murein hydrolase activator EnvC family protein [Bacillus sp. Marseille-P3661]|uniref:murein hydrolase activator EnvC family protein n=1 Tax=Bacillus sp. Marseille-P3661 TaxID=1936234 RepID=UPI000C81B193|nr:M23 family metallopeptidase [Bacillus sp. Marseille-P3661]